MKTFFHKSQCFDCENQATKILTDFWLGMSYMPKVLACDTCTEKITDSKRIVGVESILFLGELTEKEVIEMVHKWSILHKKEIDWKNIPILSDEESK